MTDVLADLPEELNFYIPGDDDGEFNYVELHPDEFMRYGQLVCWCLIQRFWYYVLGTPQAPDTEYDMIEAAIKELEENYPHSLDHPYSPTKRPGSDFLTDYPSSIVNSFFCIERLGCTIQQYRLRSC